MNIVLEDLETLREEDEQVEAYQVQTTERKREIGEGKETHKKAMEKSNIR